MLTKLARVTLDLLLPPHCASCDAPSDAPGLLCATCFQRISFIAEPACRCCGLPFATQSEAGLTRLCQTCRETPPAWENGRAAMLYDAHSRRLVLALKHADREENALALALHMQRAGARLLANAQLLVPVPLHRWRLFTRRYNQSVLLARVLARRTKLPLRPRALRRIRPTPSLGGLHAGERAQALRGAIIVPPAQRPHITGQRVLLIDDVLTSGATANECARALLDAGAANVDLLVASRVPDPRRRTGYGATIYAGPDDEDD